MHKSKNTDKQQVNVKVSNSIIDRLNDLSHDRSTSEYIKELLIKEVNKYSLIKEYQLSYTISYQTFKKLNDSLKKYGSVSEYYFSKKTYLSCYKSCNFEDLKALEKKFNSDIVTIKKR